MCAVQCHVCGAYVVDSRRHPHTVETVSLEYFSETFCSSRPLAMSVQSVFSETSSTDRVSLSSSSSKYDLNSVLTTVVILTMTLRLSGMTVSGFALECSQKQTIRVSGRSLRLIDRWCLATASKRCCRPQMLRPKRECRGKIDCLGRDVSLCVSCHQITPT